MHTPDLTPRERLREFPHTCGDDDPHGMYCEHCGHAREDHAFFPTGESAPLCVAEYKPDDPAVIDHNCDCEGFVLMPHA